MNDSAHSRSINPNNLSRYENLSRSLMENYQAITGGPIDYFKKKLFSFSSLDSLKLYFDVDEYFVLSKLRTLVNPFSTSVILASNIYFVNLDFKVVFQSRKNSNTSPAESQLAWFVHSSCFILHIHCSCCHRPWDKWNVSKKAYYFLLQFFFKGFHLTKFSNLSFTTLFFCWQNSQSLPRFLALLVLIFHCIIWIWLLLLAINTQGNFWNF